MIYIIEEGSFKRAKYMFILTGIFLIILFSYQFYDYLQINQFIYVFPGDWDKPIGILVGIFLLIRSRKFVVRSRDLFIKISNNQLTYRLMRSDTVHRIALSEIKEINKKAGQIILRTKDSTKIVIADFNKARIKESQVKFITKSLIEELN